MGQAGVGGRPVTIDLQAAQSPGYRDRGVARYAMDFTAAVAARHPDLVGQVLLNPDLPPVGVERLAGAVPIRRRPVWPAGRGVFHVLSPFELEVAVARLWPREVSHRGLRTVVTVYDLIPELFPDVYLQDPGLRRRYRARHQLVRAADHVMTLSRSAAEDVVGRLGVPARRVTVVGAATGGAFRRPASREAARAALAAALPAITGGFVVYNGAVEPRKNMEGLLEAYALLPAHLRDRFQLVLVCRLRPLERNHFEVRARNLGVADRLVLTGYLPDSVLVALYQVADLAVFPSLYEGYGLPVAEAMACGAPAIASDTSSLVELVAPGATFDPRVPGAIASAMASALEEGPARERLVEWSARPQPTWADVGDRAAEVYRELAAPAVRPSLPTWRRRARIAFVTPWPPSMTGVAGYSARMVEALRAYAEVDVYADGDPAPGRDPERAGLEDPAALPVTDLVLGGYDAVLAALGNSEFHAAALRLVRAGTVPVVVHAHDVRLVGLYLHSAARGAVPEGFEQAVTGQYPGLPGLVRDGRLPPEVAAREGVFMLRDIAAHAAQVLLSSPAALELGRLDCRPEDAGKLAVWPFAYPPAAPRTESHAEAELLCSFGVVNEAKCPDRLVAALARLLPGRPALRLAFVGPVSDEQRHAIEQQAERLGVGAAVTVTGAVGDATYWEWLGRAGLAVQLRAYSNGESSAAVADCLARGVPTVVSAIGPQVELAGVTAQVPAAAGDAELAALLDGLLADRAARHELGQLGLRWALDRSFDRAARQLFDLVPGLALYRPGRGR